LFAFLFALIALIALGAARFGRAAAPLTTQSRAEDTRSAAFPVIARGEPGSATA